MEPSAFCQLCERRNVLPAEWRRALACPLSSKKCLLDMTDQELEDHYTFVTDRAEQTAEDRALLCLERELDGRLERQAAKCFKQHSGDSWHIEAEQVPRLLEALRFEVSNVELHYLLRKFSCTDDFDMIPDALLTKRQWLWLVGECIILKKSYRYVTEEAFEICYETVVESAKAQHFQELCRSRSLALSAPAWFQSPEPEEHPLHPEVEAELAAQLAEDMARRDLPDSCDFLLRLRSPYADKSAPTS